MSSCQYMMKLQKTQQLRTTVNMVHNQSYISGYARVISNTKLWGKKKKHLASISFNGILIRTTLKAVGCDTIRIMRKLVWKVLFVILFFIQQPFTHKSG